MWLGDEVYIVIIGADGACLSVGLVNLIHYLIKEDVAINRCSLVTIQCGIGKTQLRM